MQCNFIRVWTKPGPGPVGQPMGYPMGYLMGYPMGYPVGHPQNYFVFDKNKKHKHKKKQIKNKFLNNLSIIDIFKKKLVAVVD